MGQRTERVGVEVCGYREADNGPRDVRVDLVDSDQTTLASLLPDDALILAGRLVLAWLEARREQRQGHDSGA